MTNKPKQIGTLAETAIVKYAKQRGFTNAKRIALSGVHDKGDVELSDYVMIEAKSGHQAETASQKQIIDWLTDTLREQLEGGWRYAFLITKKKGASAHNVGDWYAWVILTRLLAPHAHDFTVPVVCRFTVEELFDIFDRYTDVYGKPTITEA